MLTLPLDARANCSVALVLRRRIMGKRKRGGRRRSKKKYGDAVGEKDERSEERATEGRKWG